MTVVALATAKARHLAMRVTRPAERRSSSRSATRALDVLELFGEARRPLRSVEIAQALSLTPSSANQLLKTMVDSAHLLFDARAKTYFPSPRLAGIGGWLAETYGAGGRLGDLVREVSARTGLVATVTTPNDLSMQIIDVASPDGLTGERGLRISLFGSAIGSAFLSTLPEPEMLRLAERARIPAGELPAMRTALGSIRESGFAAGATSGDIWSVAVALPGEVLRGQGVLGIAGPAERVAFEAAAIALALHQAVAQWLSAEGRPGTRG
jgi:DNA-binding IclR family transcriptional regulator